MQECKPHQAATLPLCKSAVQPVQEAVKMNPAADLRFTAEQCAHLTYQAHRLGLPAW